VPGARIRIPELVIELIEPERRRLDTELLLTDRPGAAYDARSIADALVDAGTEPIELSDEQALAVVRALDNLRWAGHLTGMPNLIRLRDALSMPGIAYELLMLAESPRREGFTSWSGPYDVGDRLCNREGTWRVVEVQEREPEQAVLTCHPFEENWQQPS
jgi:hypothetical protein